MKTFFLSISILLLPIFANGQEKLSVELLEKYKWSNNNFDNCTRYYHFKISGSFEYWNCSMNELDTGRFEIQNDTLMIYEYHLKSEIPEHFGGKKGTEIRFQYNYVLRDGFLYQVYYRDYNNNYESFEKNSLRKYEKKRKEITNPNNGS